MGFQFAALLLLVYLGLSSLGCDQANPDTVKSQSNSHDVQTHSTSQETNSANAFTDSNSPAINQHNAGESNGSEKKLIIEIVTKGYELGGGPLRVALYDGPKTFNKVDLAKWKDVFEPDGMPIQIELERSLFPSNELAVAIYQDSNSNNQLDKNTFGIPQEAYGFSNNPKRGFGPPKYAEVVIPVPAEKLSLTITLK